MRPTLNNDAAGHPKTGPRRTLRAAKDLKDLVPQRRYPVLGWPRCCLRNEFVQCSMTNLLNLTHTTLISVFIVLILGATVFNYRIISHAGSLRRG